MKPEEISRRIMEALEGAVATATDMTGTGNHFDVVVEAPVFAGLSSLARHQRVYALFREELATERIHALKLETRAPGES